VTPEGDAETEVRTEAGRAPEPPAEIETDRRTVVCPECGTRAPVTLNRRDAVDFCAKCDFPLFWTPTEISRGSGEGGGDSLRRLPGTAGRQTVASVPCPSCAEANPLGTDTCLRCGGPMVIVPLPEPEPIPEPVAEPVVVPEKRPFPWYWLVVAIATLVALVALVVVLLNR